MNRLATKFFQENPHVAEVLILSEMEKAQWDELEKMVPTLSRAWFELSRIVREDRILFTRDFWLDTIPYQPSVQSSIHHFFHSLDDVAVLVAKIEGIWQPQLVYSLQDNSCFFRGLPPAPMDSFLELQEELDFAIPQDWRTFCTIHNGFGKLSELGLLKVEEVMPAKRRLMKAIYDADVEVKSGDRWIDPDALIPFYEAFGLHSFQCFYVDWYPEDEMGNVYFSGIDYTISNTHIPSEWNDNGAFCNFSQWLVSYLEGMMIVS